VGGDERVERAAVPERQRQRGCGPSCR